MWDSLRSDLRFAFRFLTKRPLYSVILIVILGVGLGANAAMFSVVDSVLLESLPFPDSERLVWVWGRTPEGNNNTISAEDYADYREQSSSFAELAAYGSFPEQYVATGEEEPEVLIGAQVTWNLFRTLQVQAASGRVFLEEDEQPGTGEPVILSHGLWQRRFGSDPNIVGQPLVLDGVGYEVAGIMPDGFAYPSWAELWRPTRFNHPSAQGRGNRNFLVLGRLAPGVTVEQAETELVGVARGIADDYPDVNQGWSVSLIRLQELYVSGVRGVLWILLGAVTLVLLVACANVAALLLARATGREGEIAMRVALGASRGRIARQLLTESVVTALLGGLLGIGIAYGALAALRGFGGASLPSYATIQLDGTALLFTLAVSVVTGLLFGLVPALRAPRLAVVETLKEGHRGLHGRGGLGLQSGLVVVQVALSLMLLVGSGLLIRSFLEVQGEDLGFQPESVLTAEVRLPRASYGPDRPPTDFYDAALARIRALPGVGAAGVITALPVAGGFGPWNYVHAEGNPPPTPADRRGAVRRVVSADYFEAMGIPLLRGRTFSRSDTPDAPFVGIISQQFAEQFFPDVDALGQNFVLPWDPPVPVQIIGVVGDVRLGAIESDMRPTMYWALGQNPRLSTYIVVRGRQDPSFLGPTLRSAIQEIDSDVPVSDVAQMTSVVSASLARNRFRTLLLGCFAGLALLLASLGLYGVVSQLVSYRTHEVGIRIALGADSGRILRSVLRFGMQLAAAGLFLGLAGAIAASRLVRGLLYQVEPLDTATFVVMSLALGLVTLAATVLPAWRATRVDPLESLRAE